MKHPNNPSTRGISMRSWGTTDSVCPRRRTELSTEMFLYNSEMKELDKGHQANCSFGVNTISYTKT